MLVYDKLKLMVIYLPSHKHITYISVTEQLLCKTKCTFFIQSTYLKDDICFTITNKIRSLLFYLCFFFFGRYFVLSLYFTRKIL